MLEALDAVGVDLVVVGLVVMDDALEVAALPHLLLHMHQQALLVHNHMSW